MLRTLQDSIAYCESVARRTARNFYYSFLALPRPMRRDMCVLYAFMRHCDDMGDAADTSAHQKLQQLDRWQASVTRAVNGTTLDAADAHLLLPALVDIVERHRIPLDLLFAVIDGMRMDLELVRIQTFEELQHYCYHVAGVVGLCCIHIWGFHDDRAQEHAIDCGLAFQLTNILRDVDEDLAIQRIYLPAEDLRRFELNEQDLIERRHLDRFRDMMQFQTQRARQYYQRAQKLFDYIDPSGRPILWCMMRIYHGLLERIERNKYDVFNSRVRVPAWQKAWFVCRALMRTKMPHANWSIPSIKRER
ncbi:MAG: phytoene/squalene synthase family protein [Planctomycetota bacterium]|nr:phytoene/squalene synthase family protein [Planctomycetota bacterium]